MNCPRPMLCLKDICSTKPPPTKKSTWRRMMSFLVLSCFGEMKSSRIRVYYNTNEYTRDFEYGVCRMYYNNMPNFGLYYNLYVGCRVIRVKKQVELGPNPNQLEVG